MKKAIGVALFCLAAVCVHGQSWVKKESAVEKTKGWLVDYEAAKREAAASKQPILAFFTGSDWCGWCIKLRSEALDTKAFEKFAADNVVLFEADFPNNKKISDKVRKQNEGLAAKFGVRGYPTVLLLDAEGNQLGKTGYQTGGGDAYVAHLKELLDKAGVKTTEKPAAAKALSAYEKMKAEKSAKAADADTKK